MSLRELARLSGLGLNRAGKIMRGETPPATIGEIGDLSGVFGLPASDVIAASERGEYVLAANDQRPDETGPDGEDAATEG